MTTPSPTTVGTDQETFMARVLGALGHSTTTRAPDPPDIDESLARVTDPSDDLLALFETEAKQVGMVVHRVDLAELADAVTRRLVDAGTKTVATGIADAALSAPIHDALTQHKIDLYDWRRESALNGLFDIDAGITDVHAALAETGTLICCSDDAHGRCLSLVPPVHLAIVCRSNVLADMIDFWKSDGLGNATPPPSSISLITGPSKTADIEGELITGVHGPKDVWIFLVEDR